MTRRVFLAGLLATPAVVRAQSIWVPPRRRLLRTGQGMVRITGGQRLTILRDGRVMSVIAPRRIHVDPVIDAAPVDVRADGTTGDLVLADLFDWWTKDDRA